MKLHEALPRRVAANGRNYRVDLDFRNVLRMMEILARDDLLPGARDWLALKCIMRRPPKDSGAVLLAVKTLLFPGTKAEADGKKLTDFAQDADLIRAAFWQTYGINLYRDRLHWLEFSALLHALPEGTRYSEILGIRARPMPTPTKYNQAEREWLAKAKAACALQMSDDERERNYARSVKNIFAGLLAMANGSDSDGG
jgi:hypothetical protein